MADDDSFAFTSELLAELGKRDPAGTHYLGYAFLAAPHLEGVIPGKRQPTFGNGGAGIAVSRGAMRAAIGGLDACEQAYKWNWPGDTRVAQCLVDAGVKLEYALGRGGAYSLVRFFLDVEWRHRRRASFSGAADARAAGLSSQL